MGVREGCSDLELMVSESDEGLASHLILVSELKVQGEGTVAVPLWL